ncbi:hypothetical protein [Fretibacter rubidus]|uniref:hypothetical protein n=1 Tax=Fretibacter rubidus TaxID=570162 RepID=UPI00352B8E61
MTVIKMTATLLAFAFIVVVCVADTAHAKDGKRAHAMAIKGIVPDGLALKKRTRPYIPIKARESAMCCAKFAVNKKGRPTDIDMRCTDRLFKDVASKALRRWEFRATDRAAPMIKRDGATAAFAYGIYNRGNKRKIDDNKFQLIIDGQYDLNPDRVCPMLFED